MLCREVLLNVQTFPDLPYASISELQKSIKANKVISYLSEKTEAREETKGADYGGTT